MMPSVLRLRKYLLLLLLVIPAGVANAREKRTVFVHSYRNLITANIPTYVQCAKFPGIGLGLTYERFIDRKKRFSAAASIYRVWAGTFVRGKFSPGEERSNLQIKLFQPAVFWHTDDRSGFSFGVSFPVGSVHRIDYVGTNNSGSLPYARTALDETAAIIGLLGHLSVTTYSRYSSSHFAIVFSLAGGAILSAASTHGALAELGIAFGEGF